jgi:diguanylate cyclase (GGDEF)-like protein
MVWLRRTILGLLLAGAYLAPASARAQSAEATFETRISKTKASMMSDPETALANARAAGLLARSLPAGKSEIALATSEWLQGEALTRLGKPDLAAPIVAGALATVETREPRSKLLGDLLRSSASIASKTGNVQSALVMLHRAYAIYQLVGETRGQAMALQNIGSLYYDARDYARALRYYDQAQSIYRDDPAITVSLHNNRGNALKDMGRFAEAEREYRSAVKIAQTMESPLLEAHIISNIASAQFMAGKLDQAEASVRQGLRRAAGAGAEERPFLWGTRAQILLARGDPAAAAEWIARSFAGVDIGTSTMAFRDFHETASQIYAALGQSAMAYAHLRAFKRLDDSGRDLAASTNSALVSARFDTANQRLKISQLEAQQVQRELALAHSRHQLRDYVQMTVLAGGAAIIVFVALTFAFLSARRRRKEVSAINAQLTYAANHDLLTGLANRAYFRPLFEGLLAESVAAGDRCAILLVDLDRFKWVNDTLGHNAGDELLCAVARTLEQTVGERGHSVRLGGDEFAVVVPTAPDDAALCAIGSDIVASLSAPRVIANTTITIGATVGIAVGPVDGGDITTLTRRADLALYQGKAGGRGCAIRYLPAMQAEVDERQQIEADLVDALERGEISIAYQTIVDANDQAIVGYEALLRWQHPTRGSISPAVFVPIAEEAGLINRIGDWVLRSACAEAARWPEHIKLAVNLSSLQVEGNGLSASVVSALAASGLNANRLELEVTESVFLDYGSKSDEALERLRAIGVSLALDDFGTGYSSLGYLRRAAFSTIKVDQSFVKSACRGEADSIAIVRAIVALAADLGIRTTAEGIETADEMEQMRALGCGQLQGYLFSKPSASPSADQSNSWAAPLPTEFIPEAPVQRRAGTGGR